MSTRELVSAVQGKGLARTLGRKQIFLPNFVIRLVRNPPNAGPYFASFIVPLNLNKLDLRDYLWNVYGVAVLGVRSYITQPKWEPYKPGTANPKRGHYYRPQGIKKMMVELQSPFAFPEEPKDYDLWDKKTYTASNEDRDEFEKYNGPNKAYMPNLPEMKSIGEQAKELLSSKNPRNQWKPQADKEDEWEEVEQEVDVNQSEEKQKS